MSNQKGFTLVELLAAIVLLSLVTISAVTVTAQAMQQNERANVTDSLRNDATYFTQVLRTSFENGALKGTCFADDEFQSKQIDLSLSKGNEITNLVFSYPGGEESPDCFNSQSEVQTLQVNFTISNQDGESFDVDTAFTKPTSDDLAVTISQPSPPPALPDNDNDDDDGNEEDEPGESTKPGENEDEKPSGDNTENPENPGNETEKPGNPGENENEPKPEDPDEENTSPEPEKPYKPEEPSDPTTKIPDGCDYYGDTKLADFQFGDWKYCPIINIHQGSLWIPMSTSIFIQFNIDHNFYVAGDLVGQHNAVINAKDDSFIKRNVNLHSQNVFTGRNLTADGTFILDTNSSVSLKESLQTGGTTEFRSNTKVTAGKDVTLGGNTTIQENAKVNTGGNFLLNGNLQLTSNPNIMTQGNTEIRGSYNSENNSYFEVGKNFTIAKKITLKSKSVLYAKGDVTLNGDVHVQENAKIISDGNIHIKGKISPDWGGGTICAKGDIKMDQLYSGHELKIQSNNQTCQK
ncbi:prepilin-type N-terminal cleavage/methylation domain-containing protein [Terribacillus saccharophilus]|uniref:prepilin-type N-terminal cleavage/methylation domain-containing protein n=1 Tax=Terribacillus saccharophilus TaxID=361277 RepID=UPI003981ED3E